eukprot:scaffold3068_cov401-Prasinococcus_capsulatus_cf.AAC.43
MGSCAVVGSAASLTGSGAGASIDAHSAVFRINEAPTIGYEYDVGSFTTVRLQNRERGGFAERSGEICFIKDGRWYEGHDSGGKCTFMNATEPLKQYLQDYFKWYPRDPSFNRSSIPRSTSEPAPMPRNRDSQRPIVSRRLTLAGCTQRRGFGLRSPTDSVG